MSDSVPEKGKILASELIKIIDEGGSCLDGPRDRKNEAIVEPGESEEDPVVVYLKAVVKSGESEVQVDLEFSCYWDCGSWEIEVDSIEDDSRIEYDNGLKEGDILHHLKEAVEDIDLGEYYDDLASLD